VTAPAIEGRANEAVRRLVAKRLGVARSSVTIVAGIAHTTKSSKSMVWIDRPFSMR